VLIAIGGALFGLFIASIACFFAGGAVFGGSLVYTGPGGMGAALLSGLGLMAGSASVASVLSLISIGLVNALVWYGRLHFRLLKPAIEN